MFNIEHEIKKETAAYFAITIPEWLRERKRDSEGCKWFYNLRLGIYEKTPKDEGCFRGAGL